MAVKQLSVYLENKPGRLLEQMKKLADAKINIRGMCIAEANDFGIVRLIVPEIAKAKKVLEEDALVTVTKVVGVEMKDEAGALSDILTVLAEGKINIEYMYASPTSVNGRAFVILRVSDCDSAERCLTDKGIPVLYGTEYQS